MKKEVFEKKLFFDELDIFILKNILSAYQKGEEKNTWEIAKEFVSKKSNKNISTIYQSNKFDVDGIYRIISIRLSKYKKFGIIRVVKNGGKKNIFELDLDSLTIAKHRFSDGFHECLLIRID